MNSVRSAPMPHLAEPAGNEPNQEARQSGNRARPSPISISPRASRSARGATRTCRSARAVHIRALGPLVQRGNGPQWRRRRSAPSVPLPKIYIHGLMLRRQSSKMGAHEEGGELVPGGRAPRRRGRRSCCGSCRMRELLSLSYIWEDVGGNEGSLIRRGSDESFVGAVFLLWTLKSRMREHMRSWLVML